MSMIRYDNNELFFTERKVTLEYPIQTLRKDKDTVYILLDIPAKSNYNFDDFHNVYAFSNNGEKKWQIGQREVGDDDIYTLINIKEGYFYATDFSGRRYQVNKISGKPEKMDIVK
ncbi:hypothetical protein [Amphibacillus cookii]|uniref:hypothetical protein n=1 Tax=Amphibacillus cookii TaxID=767787 RepID=UPI001959F9FB|nr:hypothetical protein [Amphibacillus cookii]MBM7541125.1 hypothetical protein [Amphibacillus cookii]